MDSEAIVFGGRRKFESIYDDQGFDRSVTDGAFYDTGYDGTFFFDPPGGGQNDGVFQPGEPIADRGARVILHPRVAKVFRVGRLAEVAPEVGWQQTLYRTDRQQFAERGLFTARLDVRGRLVQDYARPGGQTLRHVLEPRFGWAVVSSRKQRSNPLFVPRASVEQVRVRTLSLENVTRNPSDRTESANKFVLGLGQRFFTARRRGPARLRADLLTAVDWDFENGDLGNLIAEGRIFGLGPFRSRVRAAFDPESVTFGEGEVELNAARRFEDAFVRRLELGFRYRYLRQVPNFQETNRGFAQSASGDGQVNQLVINERIELSARWRLSHAMIYSLAPGSEGGVLTNEGTVEYVSKCRCWGVGVSVFKERRAGVGAGLQIRFLGLGDQDQGLFDSGLGTRFNYF
jgi:hypothetical protein